MNINEITRIAELMTKHEITEFVVESDDLKLSLKRGSVVQMPSMPMPSMQMPMMSAAASAAAAVDSSAAVVKDKTIDSPIVGTFYAASAPDAPAFVKVGDEVKAETVICIIEAMKVMNEIKAECSGVIRKILIENGMPVEYGQPLFAIEPK